MSIYERKERWKLLLILGATIIIVASLWYTNRLAGKIAVDEKRKVQLWANAIQKKAKLVRYTNDLFDRIAKEERKKVTLWANATRKLVTLTGSEDIKFYLDIIRDNETVPVILTDEQDMVISFRNLDSSLTVRAGTQLDRPTKKEFTVYSPIEVGYANQKNYLYYKDSRLFTELRVVLNDLVKSFISEVVINSASVPVILTDSQKQVIASGNVDSLIIQDKTLLAERLSGMAFRNTPLVIDIGNREKNYIYYQDSLLLTQLKYFPYVQLGLIGLFLLVAYLAFNSARNAEQNQVWIGMAKETAHQLGTPISSLIGWLENLKASSAEKIPSMVLEMENDVSRLSQIADRFSKIGSSPSLKDENIKEVMNRTVRYIKTRAPETVKFLVRADKKDIIAKINAPLFDWVIENLLRNALNAMQGTGLIVIRLRTLPGQVIADVSDTGKGIPKSKFGAVFKAGYTTKARGWGLGLTLSKRIIENYHKGKIFVKDSTLGKGTTFRIILNN